MFNVYGHLPEQRDDNTTLRHTDQKTATEFLIYTTESESEAAEIVASGGFIKDGQWYVATRYEGAPEAGVESHLMGAMEDELPANSAAEIDASGRVRSDRSVKPMEEGDVDRILEHERKTATPDEFPRKIVP